MYRLNNSISNKISNICENEYEYFLNKSNVIGVGLGFKIKRGINTHRKCIKVFVTKKMYKNFISPQNMIPPFYRGIITDVVECGEFDLQKLNSRIRPVLGGYSIGPISEKGGGSMGCLVTDNHDYYILSCNHVLAYENKLPIGTAIVQPDVEDGGKSPQDIVGGLSQFIPIRFQRFSKNYVDCAIARVLNRANVSSKIALIGNIKGLIDPKIGDTVQKVGSITEKTHGEITATNVSIKIKIGSNEALFKQQIFTSKMSERGDSGAILLNNNNYAIGLLMGGNKTNSMYNKLSIVLEELSVLLVTDNK